MILSRGFVMTPPSPADEERYRAGREELREALRGTLRYDSRFPLRWHSLSCACGECLDAGYLACIRMASREIRVAIG